MTIIKFAIPAVGVWLCSPMLSLIDTSAVGILSGTTQQAALNPAVAVTDYAALLMVSPGIVSLCNIVYAQTPSLTF
jgi:Na+-driven multidrug efflux pump